MKLRSVITYVIRTQIFLPLILAHFSRILLPVKEMRSQSPYLASQQALSVQGETFSNSILQNISIKLITDTHSLNFNFIAERSNTLRGWNMYFSMDIKEGVYKTKIIQQALRGRGIQGQVSHCTHFIIPRSPSVDHPAPKLMRKSQGRI